MARVLVHVEGQTEETFVNEIIAPHLYNYGYEKVSARLLGNARQRDQRGGIKPWRVVQTDVLNHLREDLGCLATIMVDYYGLPQTGASAWPGREMAGGLPFPQKAPTVQNALLDDICREVGDSFDPSRFIPYVMMHEFEGLLFSNCTHFGQGIGRPEFIPQFQEIRNVFATPEEINDSPFTAPSKRVEALVPGYQKPLLGTLAVQEIGLGIIRAECPHFRNWLDRLESWPQSEKADIQENT